MIKLKLLAKSLSFYEYFFFLLVFVNWHNEACKYGERGVRTRVAVFTYVSGFVALVGITVMLKSFTQGLPYFITTPSRAGLENGEREWGKLVVFFSSLFSILLSSF